MSDFNYHLESEIKNGKPFLFFRTEGDRKVSTPQEKAALEFLLKQKEPFYVPSDKALEAIKLVSLTRKLHWNKQRLIFNPFASVSFSYELSYTDDKSLIVTGKYRTGDVQGTLSECDWFFPSDPPCFIKNGLLQVFKEEIDVKWYSFVSLEPKILTASACEKFLKNVEEKDESFPSVTWISEKPLLQQVQTQVLPFLILSDRSGAFADLWFDYGEDGKVAFHDPRRLDWRQLESEKNWEKDLLETDFIKKIVGLSHYYSPLDKVGKSLTFLLEIGWKIYDHQGRQVVRQVSSQIDAQMGDQAILVQGKVKYEQHEANLTDLIGAFNRREQFLQLDGQTVGLIDRLDVEKQWGDLAEEEIVSHSFSIKKNRVGLLSSFLEKKQLLPNHPVVDWAKRLTGEVSFSEAPPLSSFHGNLFSYQQEGVSWLDFLKTWGLSGLLADEMGLGKTVQVLAFFSRLSHKKPTLIVAPTSLLFNWQREIEKFLPSFSVYVHSGKERLKEKESLQEKTLILTSYAQLRQSDELFQSLDYEFVVLDEGQYIKNPTSQIAQTVFQLKADMRLVVTGTPIENRWEDLWSLFHFLMPDLLGEKQEFNAKMLAAVSDSRYLNQTKRKIRPFFLRRRKEDVAKQLPPKIEQTIWVEMGEKQRSIYEEWMRKNSQGLLKKVGLEGASSHRMEILEAILRLRQMCAHPWLIDGSLDTESAKLERLLADLDEVVADKRKVLIYSQFTQMLHLIEKELKQRSISYVYLDGSTKDREQVVRKFQEDPDTQVFLISLKAGGVGLNLTAADYVFIYDPWWNEAAENQAIDRAHRVGREGAVIARRYVTALTIEEKLMNLKKHKRAIADGILTQDLELTQLTMEDLKELLT